VLSETAAAKTVQILNITDKWAQNLGLSAKTSFSGAILGRSFSLFYKEKNAHQTNFLLSFLLQLSCLG